MSKHNHKHLLSLLIKMISSSQSRDQRGIEVILVMNKVQRLVETKNLLARLNTILEIKYCLSRPYLICDRDSQSTICRIYIKLLELASKRASWSVRNWVERLFSRNLVNTIYCLNLKIKFFIFEAVESASSLLKRWIVEPKEFIRNISAKLWVLYLWCNSANAFRIKVCHSESLLNLIKFMRVGTYSAFIILMICQITNLRCIFLRAYFLSLEVFLGDLIESWIKFPQCFLIVSRCLLDLLGDQPPSSRSLFWRLLKILSYFVMRLHIFSKCLLLGLLIVEIQLS